VRSWVLAVALCVGCDPEGGDKDESERGDSGFRGGVGTDFTTSTDIGTDPTDTDTESDSGTGRTDTGFAACSGEAVRVVGVGTFVDLQAALDAAGTGATVIVCPGAWIGPFTAPTAISLIGEGGSAVTILDGNALGTTLTVVPGTSIEGLTLTGGDAAEGGGLGVVGAGVVTVAGSLITGNTAQLGGGAAAAGGATLDLTTSVVEANTAVTGGGVHLDDASLIGGEIRANSATDGGGVHTVGDAAIEGATLADNDASDSGGGIAADDGALLLSDVSATGNAAPAWRGGGLYAADVRVDVLGATVFSGNTALIGAGGAVERGSLDGGEWTGNAAISDGGGLFVQYGAVSDVDVHDNTAALGGGISLMMEGAIDASTITANSATLGGGGIAIGWFSGEYAYGGLYVTNTEISANAAADGGGISAAGSFYVYLSVVDLHDNTADAGGAIWAGDDMQVEVHDSAITANTALDGGGLWTETGSFAVTCTTTDWGAAAVANDNAPDDLSVSGTSYVGYEAGETFACTGAVCSPGP
jgi:hypothetical protein